mmetsp:Transcript_14806/g.28502  ORF Transcript_14806/g.28502 Transcript_14806/m.28502 type:complete len:157 (+) Transcript_14806:273-743(+)|eukprot:CAMPEP_0114250674 /NCGR_PEP_ID=MMETSP0058-20121206/14833_1 /TAXON_ID=36894 /ORGANISM="Pyramimonas parkeae, CCMP726" /LENGTH=156 /DNA_ID=CAMNT_0001364365 /DNA_START=242 /DNA_END=712 /DNA_ORIENTATION=-
MSKLIEAKMRERNDKIHKSKILHMKANVDNKAPKEFVHLQQNLKKAQLEEDRLSEVEHQNGILLQKLSKIAARKEPQSSSKALKPGEAPPPDRVPTLNAVHRKQELQKIAEENQALLKRIQAKQSSKSEYSRDVLDKDFQQHEEWVKLGRQARPAE